MSRVLFLFFAFSLQVQILLAQFGLTTWARLTAATAFSAVAVADINNDGRDDIVAATGVPDDGTTEQGMIFVYLQDTTGTLQRTCEWHYPAANPGIRALATGDVNHDGLQDILVAWSDTLGIFYQRSPCSFSECNSFATLAGVYGVKCLDMDQDGRTDILVYNGNSEIGVYYQEGDTLELHTFTVPQLYAAWHLTTGDLDGDGAPDVVYDAPMNSDTTLYVLFNDPQQRTLGRSTGLPFFQDNDDRRVLDLACGDLLGDVRDEILALDEYDDSLSLWENAGTPFSLPHRYFAGEGRQLTVTDLDCDQRKEIMVLQDFAVDVHYENDPLHDTTFYVGGQTSLPAPYGNYALGDVDHDGRPDLVRAYTKGIVIMRNTTVPDTFYTDTLTIIDTIRIRRDTSVWEETVSTADTLENAVVFRTDSFYVHQYMTARDVSFDTLAVRRGEICGGPWSDTTFLAVAVVCFYDYAYDTTIFYTALDTVALGKERIRDDRWTFRADAVRDVLYVSVPPNDIRGRCLLRIFSPAGKLLYSTEQPSTPEMIFRVPPTVRGVGIVQCISGGRSITRKVWFGTGGENP